MKAPVRFPSSPFALRRLVLAIGVSLAAAPAALAQTPTIYGLGIATTTAGGSPIGTQGLITINPATGASNTLLPLVVTGVATGQTLVGMDSRPNTGQLFALGYDPLVASGLNSQLYTLDPATGAATAVGAPLRLELGDASARIGFDFNPTVDRIRVVSSVTINAGNTVTRNNYRLNPNNGAIAATDGNLSYADGSPANPGIGAVAYTNSYAGSTATTLYDFDELNGGILSIQNPPNNGVLITEVPVMFGMFPVGAVRAIDIDIYYNAATQTNEAYLIEVNDNASPGSTNFYSLNLTTGQATLAGNTVSPGFGFEIRDIAAAIAPPTQPILTGQLVYALASGNLISFDSSNPTVIRSAVNFGGGLTAGQVVVGFDFRPATGQLVALGYNAATGESRLYTVNLTTGALTAIGAGPVTLSLGAATGRVGFDFNPTVDRIRVVGTSGFNYRLNPNDGTITATDGNLTAGPAISAAAYTNNSSAANTTVLYDYDAVAGQLYIQNPPNNGVLVAQGSASGLAASTDGADFDIFNTPRATTNTALLAFSPGGSPTTPSFDNLYSVDLTSGSLTALGRIGNGSNVSGLAAFIAQGTGLTWNGSASTDWATAANWTPSRVPTASDDVTIPGGTPNQPTVSGSQAARFVALGAGATLTSADASTLTVGGNFTNNGGTVAGAGSGTIALGGVAVQTITGTATSAFQNLTVGTAGAIVGAANMTPAAAAAVRRVLLLNGNLTVPAGQTFTLLSDAQNSAHVVNGAGAVVGNATVQRYITSANTGLGYRHYSSPVAATTFADLATGGFSPVVNPAYNMAAVPGTVTPFPTVFGYDETRVNTSGNPAPQDFDKGFFSPNALSDVLEVTRGYAVNIAGTQTVDFVGTLNNGPIGRGGLSRGSQTESGWHLMGNPYPSPIDWDLVGRSGIDATVYVVRSTGQYAGNYSSYNATSGIGTNGGTDQLAVAQGFFVRSSAVGVPGSVAFNNAARLTTYANPVFQRTATTSPLVRLDLRASTGVADETVVYFEQGATANFDSALDAYKLVAGGTPLLASQTAAERLSINALPTLGAADVVVPLVVDGPQAGTYTLQATELLNLPVGTYAYLRDAQTGTLTDLSAQPSYSFALVPGAATGRFSLQLTQQRILANAPASLSQQVAVFPNPTRGSVSISVPASLSRQSISVVLVNLLGQTVVRATLPAAATEVRTLPLPGVAQGVYTLRLQTASGVVNKRLVVE